MKWITARRRHPLAGYVVVILALAFVGVGYAFVAPSADRAQAQTVAADAPDVDLREGRQIFTESCASCHGPQGAGTETGPDLTNVGAASVDFQVSTGRMPSMNPDAQMPRRPTPFTQEEIDNLAAYVATFGEGPAVPTNVPATAPQRSDFESEEEYEAARETYDAAYEEYIAGGDTEAGMKLYLANCAHCHSWSGAGGALTDGRWAPELHEASPRQLYEAMLTGPGAMPLFNDTTLTPDEKQDLIGYVKDLQAEPNAGGVFALDRIGQVAEGFVGWTVGITLIVACAIWITAKQRAHD
ncbi:cytochrome bc1 complex diheme cytochrome c subunit [Marinitenerispora sediminis]|uniref:Cytochrome bc1 complex cytochrome c subunit n=1 Tax=Marinitenerispora sediminis TaxID=1931232 RepID=A0A368T7K6_9ACTN|nr:c-type cytochrome [Marinitenerispora sediminis]RCV54140.1 cytochrome C [Marinitenerispora sediminis]RCV56786.1 cytochrome C [Marinitenerispora sediminis]RCV59633.1 cytochrome C [Marinitenerispora sediminis]